MAIRTEQTLRRMWTESAALFQQSGTFYADADQCADAATEHERAAAAETAAAASAHEAAKAKRSVAQGKEAEAADLADLVNRERTEAGLAPLKPGEPYPAEQDPAVTRTDGEVAQP
jgi:hypothetical protein